MPSDAADIFERAIALPSGRRSDFVDRICGHDEELHRRINDLLAAHEAQRGFLPISVEGDPNDRPEESQRPVMESTGTLIGPYKLMELVGEGGFGLVFVAEQQLPVRRRVAIKVIKPGMDSREVIARFEAERQALALMDHPNIAKVLDAGTTQSGRPFFVMEWVKGVQIVKYCDQQRFDTTQRLQLFVAVCKAIQHAHGKGVIHRDLKPSNILVAPHDGKPVVKVIDFGVAKAIGQQLTDKTVYTRFSQIIGTPLYMSPEQAEPNAIDVDTRSDIYSLGVLLYELLTGTTPFEKQRFATAAFDELRRIIKEEDPPKPSTRVSSLGAKSAIVCANRRSESTRLSRLIRGDLDWIVMKTLEKDRTRRYDTATGLASDVERYLNDEPVAAVAPSTLYTMRKFARRHKVSLMTASTFVASLLLSAAVATYQATQNMAIAKIAMENEAAAKRNAREADAARDVSQKLSFDLAVDRGLSLCRQQRVGEGMHWLARGLELAPDGSDAMQRVLRAGLAGWTSELNQVDAIFPHENCVVCVAVSPDAKLILTGASDGTAKLWTCNGELIKGLDRHQEEVHEVGFSNDGALFYTTSYSGEVKIWDTQTRTRQHQWTYGHGAMGVAFIPYRDAVQLAVSCTDGSVSIRDPQTGKVEPFVKLLHNAHDLRVSRDGSRILVACHDGYARIWEVATREQIVKRRYPTRLATADFANPQGTQIVVADLTGNIYFYDTTADVEDVVKAHRSGCHRVRVNPQCTRVVVASFDNTATVWDVETRTQVGPPLEHNAAVKYAAISSEGTVVTGCDDNYGRLWRPAKGVTPRSEVRNRSADGIETVYTRNGLFLLSRTSKHSGEVRDAVTGERLGPPIQLHGGVYSMAVSPDRRVYVLGLTDGNVQVCEAATGKDRFSPVNAGAGSSVWGVDVSRDGTRFATVSFNGSAALWHAETGQLDRELVRANMPLAAVSFGPAPDGASIAAAGVDGLLRVINPATGETRELDGHRGMTQTVEFSDDGRLLISGSHDNTVRITDLATGQPTTSLLHEGAIWWAVQLNANATLAVTGCNNAQLWDVETGKPLGPPLPHSMPAQSVTFVNAGSQVLTGTPDGTTRVWDVNVAPLKGDVDQIVRWLEVSTATRLNDSGEIEPLDFAGWTDARRGLELYGGPPIR